MFCNKLLFIALLYHSFKNLFFLVKAENQEDHCGNNNTEVELPPNWPCEWNSGTIPYTFNFYLQNPNRLVSIIKRGIKYIEDRSCVKFLEHNPINLAKATNFTYIYFTYSDVLENCCLPFFTNYSRRRITLITPLCTLPVEVAHVILHTLGLKHRRREPFSRVQITNFLFQKNVDLRKLNKNDGQTENMQSLQDYIFSGFRFYVWKATSRSFVSARFRLYWKVITFSVYPNKAEST